MELEKDDNSSGSASDNDGGSPTLSRTRTTIAFPPGDNDLPYNWSIVRRYHWKQNNETNSNTWQKKKSFVVMTSIFAVMNSTVASGLASNSSPYFAREFGITSHELLVLPTSVFLLGYCIGPVVYGPMSETYGRKKIMIFAFLLYTIFTLACALSPNYASLVVFRFLAGIGAACPIVVVGGLVLPR
jgi:predicted MFS family arabinose efflux permease